MRKKERRKSIARKKNNNIHSVYERHSRPTLQFFLKKVLFIILAAALLASRSYAFEGVRKVGNLDLIIKYHKDL